MSRISAKVIFCGRAVMTPLIQQGAGPEFFSGPCLLYGFPTVNSSMNPRRSQLSMRSAKPIMLTCMFWRAW